MVDGADIPDWAPWIDCWQCGGEGETADCWEEFACIDPESGCADCRRRCDICHGKGGWPDPAYLDPPAPVEGPQGRTPARSCSAAEGGGNGSEDAGADASAQPK